MPKGIVKWFNQQIGAGFIKSNEGESFFFRHSAVRSEDLKAMREGQFVSFEVARDIRSISPTAANVRPVEYFS
jgi:cold shock CspA family protein